MLILLHYNNPEGHAFLVNTADISHTNPDGMNGTTIWFKDRLKRPVRCKEVPEIILRLERKAWSDT